MHFTFGTLPAAIFQKLPMKCSPSDFPLDFLQCELIPFWIPLGVNTTAAICPRKSIVSILKNVNGMRETWEKIGRRLHVLHLSSPKDPTKIFQSLGLERLLPYLEYKKLMWVYYGNINIYIKFIFLSSFVVYNDFESNFLTIKNESPFFRRKNLFQTQLWPVTTLNKTSKRGRIQTENGVRKTGKVFSDSQFVNWYKEFVCQLYIEMMYQYRSANKFPNFKETVCL